MKEKTKVRPVGRRAARRWLLPVGWALCGWLLPQWMAYGRWAPLGVAAVAAAPGEVSVFVTVAALLGSRMAADTSGALRYMAAIAAVAGLRWALRGIGGKDRELRVVVRALLAALATAVAGIFLRIGSLTAAKVALTGVDALLAGAGTWLLDRGAGAVRRLAAGRSMDPDGQVVLMTAAALLLSAAARWQIGPVTPAHAAALVWILLAARIEGASGGAPAGTLVGVFLVLSRPDALPLAAGYALAGTAAGVFSRFGRWAEAGVMLPALLLVIGTVADRREATVWMYEALAAAGIYLLLPRRWERALNAALHHRSFGSAATGMRDLLTERLDCAAEAMYSVGQTVEAVSKRLAAADACDFGTALRRLEDTVCAGCSLSEWCWNERYEQTLDTFQAQVPRLRRGQRVDAFASFIGQKCPRRAELATAVEGAWREQTLREGAWRRLSEIREAATGQFAGTGDLLRGFSADLAAAGRPDAAASTQVRMVCEGRGMTVHSALCLVGEEGRVTVEVRLGDDGGYFEETAWHRELERACGCRLEPATVRRVGGEIRLRLYARPRYGCKTAAAQKSCPGERLCGDAWMTFSDARGRECLLLCDGMGTGSRAAVDAACASGLTAGMLGAGFDADSALRMTNTALMVREGQERLSTVDLLRVDPYTGRMQCLKAGAATSFLWSGGKVSRIERPSLPIGILTEVQFEVYDDRLVPGDTVLLVSDGVLSDGSAWLEERLAALALDTDPEELCAVICAEAETRRDPLHGDDLTVCALRLEKND